MVSGLNLVNFETLPKAYNLVMTLKILAACIPLLALQSSGFLQALTFTLLEVSHLSFLVFYQFKAKALKSTFILAVRVLESSTLSLYGVVCFLYSLNSGKVEKIGKRVSAITFLLFLVTMMIEYVHLGFLVVSNLCSLLTSKGKKNNKISGADKNGLNGDKKSKKRPEDDLKCLEYWQNHPFVVIQKIKKTDVAVRESECHYFSRRRRHGSHGRKRGLSIHRKRN